jgi:hypothetical protein
MGSKRLGILREELEGLIVIRPELRGLTTARDYRLLTASDFFTSGGTEMDLGFDPKWSLHRVRERAARA